MLRIFMAPWNFIVLIEIIFTLIHVTFAEDSKSFWEHDIPQILPFWTERDKESRKRKEHMELPKLYWQEAGWENYSVANCATFLEKEMETQSIKSGVQRVELRLMENYSKLWKLIQGLPTFLSCISGLLWTTDAFVPLISPWFEWECLNVYSSFPLLVAPLCGGCLRRRKLVFSFTVPSNWKRLCSRRYHEQNYT